MIKRLYNLVIKWLQSDGSYKELLNSETLKINEKQIREVINEFVDKSFFGSTGILGINPNDIDEFKTCFKVNSDLVRPEFEQTSPWENVNSDSMRESLERVKKGIIDEIKLRTIKQISEADKKNQKIKDIGLSENANRILEKAEVKDISDLTSMRTDDIRTLDRMGFKEEKEIIAKIHSLELTFRNEDPTVSREKQIHDEINKCIVVKYNIDQEIQMLQSNLINTKRKEQRFLELNRMKRAIQKQIDILTVELYTTEEVETIKTK